MNKIGLITLLMFVFFSVKAQDSDLFSYMEEHLTAEETSSIDRAKSDLKKGDIFNAKIKAEDKKNAKYFKKKKKRKKAEKKSVAAKQMRIKQAVSYSKAYTAIYQTYLDKVNACSFYYAEDKTKVENLLAQAESNAEEATSTIDSYKKKSKKDLKKHVAYSKLQSNLKAAINNYVSAINNLIQAYSVHIDQEQKREAEQEENRVWQNAESDNTIHSYQSYLNVYRNGRYSAEANRRIRALEAKMREMARPKINGTLIYRVQIAASKKKLPRWKLARIYRKTSKITTKHYDDWYKYSLGSFSKYEEAKNYLNKINVSGAFVVAYVDGVKIDIKTAIENQ